MFADDYIYVHHFDYRRGFRDSLRTVKIFTDSSLRDYFPEGLEVLESENFKMWEYNKPCKVLARFTFNPE